MDDLWNVAQRRDHDGAVTLSFEGELDLQAADDVRRLLHDAIAEVANDETIDLEAEAAAEVVIDLDAVAFVDSSVLSAFAHARREGGDRGVRCRFERPQDHVRRIMEIAGLSELLDR